MTTNTTRLAAAGRNAGMGYVSQPPGNGLPPKFSADRALALQLSPAQARQVIARCRALGFCVATSA